MEVKDIEEYFEKLQIIGSTNINNDTVDVDYDFTAPSLGWLTLYIANTGLVDSYGRIVEVVTDKDGTEHLYAILLEYSGGTTGKMVTRNRILAQKNHVYRLLRSAENVNFIFYKLGIPEE